MRVIHINDVASVASTLAAAQAELMGQQVKLINIIPAQNKFDKIEKIITFFKRIILVINARIIIYKFKPDVIHLHYSTSALWMIGVRSLLIIHAHGSDIRLKENDAVRKIINKIGLWWADLLLYSTPDLKIFADQYNIKSRYLPNPVDINKYSCDKHHNRVNRNLKILLFAAPNNIKGFDIVSSAFKDILKKYDKLEITIFKNNESLKFSNSIKSDRIKLIEYVNQDSINNLICEHDIIFGQFIIGSYGMSELQALSCGKPLICNAKYNSLVSASVPHMQAETKEDIVNNFEYFLNLTVDELHNLHNNSIEWIKKNHNVSKVIEMMHEFYKK